MTTPTDETHATPDPAASASPLAADAEGGAAPVPPEGGPDAALRAELDLTKDKLLRLYAEFENFKRRAAKDRLDAEHRGMGQVIRGLLEGLDDLSRFAHVDPATTDAVTLHRGVEMTEGKILKALAGHGLEVVNPTGHKFDPVLHEAISTSAAASAEEDHVVETTWQVGYSLNGQLLRPARVVVKQWLG